MARSSDGTGTNARQVQAISDAVEEQLKKRGTRPLRIEGYKTAEWVLLDYGDFIFHVFEEKARRFYDLERLWRDAARVAEKLIQSIEEPINVDGQELHVSASIGIALFPQDGSTAEKLIRNADTAMYRAKAAGGATVAFFEETMNENAVRRVNISDRSRESLLDYIDTNRMFILPNTAGCFTARDAVRRGRADGDERRHRGGDRLGAGQPRRAGVARGVRLPAQ